MKYPVNVLTLLATPFSPPWSARFSKRKIIFFFAIIVFAACTVSLLAQTNSKQKNKWYIGFGIGSGIGYYDTNARSNTSFFDSFDQLGNDIGSSYKHNSPMIAFSVGIGIIVTEHIHAGLDMSRTMQWANYESYEIGGEKHEQSADIVTQNFFAVVAYYPFIDGFFVKGGIGFNTFETSIDTESNNRYTLSYGYGFLVGIGYDFWLGRTFNFGLHLDYSRYFYNENNLESSDLLYFYVSFYWF